MSYRDVDYDKIPDAILELTYSELMDMASVLKAITSENAGTVSCVTTEQWAAYLHDWAESKQKFFSEQSKAKERCDG